MPPLRFVRQRLIFDLSLLLSCLPYSFLALQSGQILEAERELLRPVFRERSHFG
jgi:hypothetical protein